MHTRPLALLAAILSASAAFAAETPPPLTIPDLVGSRTLALQAGVGAASGTEALFLNPAGLAARKRYTVDLLYLADRRPELEGSARKQDYLGASVMDSSTTPIAAGFGYVRALKGVEEGTMLRLGLAAPLTQGLYAGLQGNYFDLRGGERVASTIDLDAGLLYQVSTLVSIGAAGYNLLSGNKHQATLPQGFGVGFVAGSERSLQVVGDWRIDLERVRAADGGTKAANRYAVGAEYLFANSVPVRAGFQVDDVSETKWWSAGLGWVSARAAIDIGFRQSTTDTSARSLGVSVRVFVPNE